MLAKWSIICVALFVISGCFSEKTLLPLSRAENIRKSSDNRVFVSGVNGFYEVVQSNDGAAELQPVFESENCDYFAGIAELNRWMFFVCARNQDFRADGLTFNNAGALFAYSLDDDSTIRVAELSGYQFANGLDSVPAHNLILLADENFFGKGGITKLKLDFSSGNPQLIDTHYHWIGANQDVFSANGVRVLGNSVYLTDIGYLKRVDVDEHWRSPLETEWLFKRATVFDDLDSYCGGLLITNFIAGKIHWVSLDGSQTIDAVTGLTSPSAVLASPPSWLAEGSMVFTESIGVLPSSGNRIALASLLPCGMG